MRSFQDSDVITVEQAGEEAGSEYSDAALKMMVSWLNNFILVAKGILELFKDW